MTSLLTLKSANDRLAAYHSERKPRLTQLT